MSTDKQWEAAIATVLTRLCWTEEAIRNMLGEIVEMLAPAEPAGKPPDLLAVCKQLLTRELEVIGEESGPYCVDQVLVDKANAAISAAEAAEAAGVQAREAYLAAEPAGIPACDCGWLTRTHSTECARYKWEHRNERSEAP